MQVREYRDPYVALVLIFQEIIQAKSTANVQKRHQRMTLTMFIIAT